MNEHLDSRSCLTTCEVGGCPLRYRDSDGDGFGDPDVSEEKCEEEAGWVTDKTDCDDSDADVYPEAECGECMFINSQCACEEVEYRTWYEDADQDGYGNPQTRFEDCNPQQTFTDWAAQGYVNTAGDCDDTNADRWTGQACSTGCDCITVLNDLCHCVLTDEDNDGVCDGQDECPWKDDKVDSNNDGIKDCLCIPGEDNFDTTLLRTGSDSTFAITEKSFNPSVRDVKFKVLNVGEKPGVWQDWVEVWYTTAGSNEPTFWDKMSWDDLKYLNKGKALKDQKDWQVHVNATDISSVQVKLSNGVTGSVKNSRVNLKDLSYCANDEAAFLEVGNKGKLRVEADL